jgi:hypothetical protein
MEVGDQLGMSGYRDLLYDEKTQPDNVDNLPEHEYQLEIRMWRKSQLRACAAIRFCLGETAKAYIKDKDTVSECMDCLEKKYSYRYLPGRQKNLVFRRIMGQYHNLTLADCSNVRDFANQLYVIRSSLKLLDDSYALGEPHWIDKFLTSLGPDFNEFLIGFYMNHTLIPERDENNEITKDTTPFHRVVEAAANAESLMKMFK